MSHALLCILTLGLHATSAFQAPVRLSTGCRPAELKSIKLIAENSAKKAGASNGEIFMSIGILPGSAGNPISASNAYGVGSTNAFGISNNGYGGDIVSTGYTPYGATGYTPYGNYLNDYGYMGIGRNWPDRYEYMGGYGGYGRRYGMMGGYYGGYGRNWMMGNRYGYGGNGFGYDGYGYNNYDRRGRHHRMGRGWMNWYNGGRARYY